MTKSVCCSHGKCFLFISYLTFSQVFAMKFSVKPYRDQSPSAMEIRVIRPFIVAFMVALIIL